MSHDRRRSNRWDAIPAEDGWLRVRALPGGEDCATLVGEAQLDERLGRKLRLPPSLVQPLQTPLLIGVRPIERLEDAPPTEGVAKSSTHVGMVINLTKA